ncbi:MAG: CoA-binding protein [Bacteroidales bacterium]|nr:CoA-binding protein [Bacteroidales bacterium]
MSKKVIVIGASPVPSRYSNRAVRKLVNSGYDVTAIGMRSGKIESINIIQSMPHIEDVYSVVLYINPEIQKTYYKYILDLKPINVFFNPGTFNPEFIKILENSNIEIQDNCALVALSMGVF